MANIIGELITGGARELVAVLAEEAVKIGEGAVSKATRSPLSRGIAQIRKMFPELTRGTKGYESARNVFRMQERRARSARRETMKGGTAPIQSSPDVAPPPRPRSRRSEVYTLRVETLSQKVKRSEWIIVRVTAPAGATLEELKSLARQAVTDRINAYDAVEERSRRERIGPRAQIGSIEWIG